MKVYIYQADLYCESCIANIKHSLSLSGRVPENLDETAYDSDSYPKGPYANGGGESDTPQHCASCAQFLENPLTGSGFDYVVNAVAEHFARMNNKPFPLQDNNSSSCAEEWAHFYGIPFESEQK